MNYYNEFDPYAAQWLRNLIAAGHIPNGVVDERSIEDVSPSELAGFTQCHFFAGIAGWSLALELAGWPSDRPIWTGSCPCQPFSTAGAQAGFDDERHLWPHFHWLIQQCRPAVVVGEQVASGPARDWIDLVSADLEGLEYAFGAIAFPSASVGAPHIRDRAYWVGDARSARLQGHGELGGVGSAQGRYQAAGHGAEAGLVVRLEHSASNGRIKRRTQSGGRGAVSGCGAGYGTSPTHGFWSDADWLACRDGKWRPVEPGTFPLAHGVSGRVGRLRAYGNAINPHQAAEFLRAAL